MLDTETGELSERRRVHREEAEQFYEELKQRSLAVRVGMEASGHSRWFERLLRGCSSSCGSGMHSLSTRKHALQEERHFALVDGLRFSNLGSHNRLTTADIVRDRDFSPTSSIPRQYTLSVMRSIRLAATLLVPLVLIAQDVKRPLLSSHDRVDGPFGGEYHVEDVQIFADGKVVYVEEGTRTLGAKPERSTFEVTIGSDEMRRLAVLLDSRDIRSLPKKVSSKTRPIDFFWQKSLQINRPDKTQEIQIENFYPFLNVHHAVYPKGLIELECSLQDVKLEAAKRPHPKDEDDWCGAIRAPSGPAKADCRDDATQPRIVAGEGWGAVRVGAALQAVDSVLGTGQSGNRYSDVYFKEYVPKGVQVSFENGSNKVHAIFFYNGQRNSEEIGIFCGRTDKGINWLSSPDEVKKAYGHPTAEYSGTDSVATWQRLVFAGIDFRFENGKLVRIGIPGD